MYRVYLETSGNKPLIFGGGSPDGSPSEDLSGVEFVNGTRPGNQELMESMTAALPFMDEDMRPFAERTLQKISPLTENEYAELAIFAADEAPARCRAPACSS